MIIKIKNVQAQDDVYCGITIGDGEYYQIQSETERLMFGDSAKVQIHLAEEKILVNDGTNDLGYAEGKRWLEGNPIHAPDGKQVVQSTPRKIGTYIYFTGSGDKESDALNCGGSSDDSELFCLHHEVGNDAVQSLYRDLNTIANETHVHTGFVQWRDALNDHITFEIVPKVTPYASGSNTNFNLYGGYLIIPAAGNGLISVNSGDMKLVQCVANEFGTKPAGFWNATFNSTTKVFENITAAPYGNGEYNMFGVEVILSRFVNKLILLGDDGILPLNGSDITQIPHGGRLKVTSKTMGADHDWYWNATLVLYRKKTC